MNIYKNFLSKNEFKELEKSHGDICLGILMNL